MFSKWSPCFCLPFHPDPLSPVILYTSARGIIFKWKIDHNTPFHKHSNVNSLHVNSKINSLQRSSKSSTTLSFHLSLLPQATPTCWLHVGQVLTSVLFSQIAAQLTSSFPPVLCSNITSVIRPFLIPKSTLNYQSLPDRIKHHHFFS